MKEYDISFDELRDLREELAELLRDQSRGVIKPTR